MYYEEAKIRKYTDSKGQPYFQVRIKKGSKLTDEKEKVKPIALVDIVDIKEIANNSDINKYTELKAKFNNTSEELVEVKQELQEAKATVESLTSELEKLKEEKLQLQEDLITEKNKHKELIEAANNNVVEAKDKVIKLQEEQKTEVKELNTKLEEANNKIEKLLIVINNKDNDIVYLAKRGLGSRIRNKLTERIEATIIEVEANTSEE
ncbi:MAG: hypothetical protein IKG36_02800 [Mycoplasmataceae bacterium]|nr:hypothetical protein [Mycoplasmataceae bacterium]